MMGHTGLSRWFSWGEMVGSGEARRRQIPNQPSPGEQVALMSLARLVLDPIRDRVGRPVSVTSGYRSAELNGAIGGARGSQHTRGEAADIKVRGLAGYELAREIYAIGLQFDQLIAYHADRGGHVHISYTTRRAARLEVLWAPPEGGYLVWDPTA